MTDEFDEFGIHVAGFPMIVLRGQDFCIGLERSNIFFPEIKPKIAKANTCVLPIPNGRKNPLIFAEDNYFLYSIIISIFDDDLKSFKNP